MGVVDVLYEDREAKLKPVSLWGLCGEEQNCKIENDVRVDEIQLPHCSEEENDGTSHLSKTRYCSCIYLLDNMCVPGMGAAAGVQQ